MANITQHIPSYTGGISEQPDELKIPGQVNKAKNVLPDVVEGLLKRPGGKLVGKNISASGYESKWFSYYRDENEQYIGQIDINADVKIWRCSDGEQMPVTNQVLNTSVSGTWSTSSGLIHSNTPGHGVRVGDLVKLSFSTIGSPRPQDGYYEITTVTDANNFKVKIKENDNVGNQAHAGAASGLTVEKNYLYHSVGSDLQTLTLNDFTYVTNRNKLVTMSTDKSPVKPSEAFIQLKKVAYANQYAVNLFDDNTTQDVTTATRISLAESNLNNISTCPNVGTEIYSLGSADSEGTTTIQKFRWKLKIGASFFLNYTTASETYHTYEFYYCPPPWEGGRIYRAGDLVTGNANNSGVNETVYRLKAGSTTRETTINETAPSHANGDGPTVNGHTWETIASVQYNKNVNQYNQNVPDQIYHGERAIQITWTHNVGTNHFCDTNSTACRTINDTAVQHLEDQFATTNLPFNVLATRYDHGATDQRVEIDLTWKHAGYYEDHRTRIIWVRRDRFDNGGIHQPGTTHGGGKATGDYDSIETTGWDEPTLPSGRSDLYFRITTTGQAVPVDKEGVSTDDYTCRYTTTLDLLHGGSGWQEGDQIVFLHKDGRYRIKIDKISTSKVQANLGLIRPTPTSFDTKTTVTAESILGDLQTDIIAANTAWTAWPSSETASSTGVKIIGNGIYIRRSDNTNPFNISTPNGELLNVLSDEVKDIADLPEQCRHGYVVKVANSKNDEDDYYVKFKGQLKEGGDENDDNDYLDGKGTWQECIAPDQEYKYDPATMPIQIKREPTGSFTVSTVAWEDALVGVTAEDSTGTNPRASFVGKTINNMLFFRNRFVMLSDENVIMSQPGDFFNFWAKSAITYGNTDMIDISCSSEYPAIVYDGIQVNSGLVLFTKNQQFMLTTDSDLLNPLTAKINSLSTYNFNFKTNPFSLGTTIGFLDNAGKYNRFWEMTAVLREGDPNVIEQSKTISKSFPNDIDMVANSRENQVVFFGKKGTSTVYGFRYHTDAASRIQQAWFEWELKGAIQHICMLDDALYVVLKNQEDSVYKYHIEKYEIKSDDPFVIDTDFNVHLDKSFKINSSDIAYPLQQLRLSGTLTDIENFYNSDTDLVAYVVSGNYKGNRYTTSRNNSNKHIEITSLPNDGNVGDIILGYEFETEVELPKIYLQQKAGDSFRSDIQSSLTLQRLKLNFGDFGTCTTTLNREVKGALTTTHTAKPITSSVAARPFIQSEETLTIPVYEKNKNVTITIKSKHPSPSTLHSMNWEGDYTDKYYKRV